MVQSGSFQADSVGLLGGGHKWGFGEVGQEGSCVHIGCCVM